LTIITNVSHDHINYLGTTLKKIAQEKAAIIKYGIPCITAAKGEALEVIRKECLTKKSDLITITSTKAEEITKYLELSLSGEFQKKNAALAIEASRLIGSLDEKIIGFALKNTKWPGRFEKRGDLIIDCGHNPAGLKAIFKEVPDNIPVVFGVLKDKPVKVMTQIIQSKTKNIILTKPYAERAMDVSELSRFFQPDAIVSDNPKHAVEIARKMFNKNILVIGSCYLAKEFV
jgi:dihydrofolate synthase / folylpolyglutamate synthase